MLGINHYSGLRGNCLAMPLRSAWIETQTMTRQEQKFIWVGLAALCAIGLGVEFVVTPNSPEKPIVILVLFAVIGYALYRASRRHRRHRGE